MAEELYVNDPGTTLASAITSTSATSLSVASSSGYPPSGNFRILIDTELIQVTAVSGTTWTIVRGIEGTTAATHSSGTAVNAIITAGAWDAIRSNQSSFGPFSGLPTTGKAGDRYKQTDGPYEWISNGSTWQAFWNGYPVTLPPSSGWTAEGIASESGSSAGTSHYTNGFGYLIGNGLGSQSVGVNYMAAPSTPYHITARLMMEPTGIISSKFYGIGASLSILGGTFVGFRDSGGKYIGVSVIVEPGSPNAYFTVKFFNPDTTISSTLLQLSNSISIGSLLSNKDFVYRIGNDGTNISFGVSISGQDVEDVYSEAITTHLSNANNVCWGALKDGGSAALCLYDWTIGT